MATEARAKKAHKAAYNYHLHRKTGIFGEIFKILENLKCIPLFLVHSNRNDRKFLYHLRLLLDSPGLPRLHRTSFSPAWLLLQSKMADSVQCSIHGQANLYKQTCQVSRIWRDYMISHIFGSFTRLRRNSENRRFSHIFWLQFPHSSKILHNILNPRLFGLYIPSK